MKKILLILLAVSLIAVSTAGCAGQGITPEAAGAANEPEVIICYDELIVEGESELDRDIDDTSVRRKAGDPDHYTEIPGLFSVTGIVMEIEENEGLIFVSIEDLEGIPAVFVITEDTVFPFENEINVGDTITGWYRTDIPMILIWPSQYALVALAAGTPDDVNIRADRFFTWEDGEEGYVLSQDEMFAFRIDENTEIILADGQDFRDGELSSRRIVVIYGASTESIPELATADKLIVLFEDIVPAGG